MPPIQFHKNSLLVFIVLFTILTTIFSSFNVAHCAELAQTTVPENIIISESTEPSFLQTILQHKKIIFFAVITVVSIVAIYHNCNITIDPNLENDLAPSLAKELSPNVSIDVANVADVATTVTSNVANVADVADVADVATTVTSNVADVATTVTPNVVMDAATISHMVRPLEVIFQENRIWVDNQIISPLLYTHVERFFVPQLNSLLFEGSFQNQCYFVAAYVDNIRFGWELECIMQWGQFWVDSGALSPADLVKLMDFLTKVASVLSGGAPTV